MNGVARKLEGNGYFRFKMNAKNRDDIRKVSHTSFIWNASFNHISENKTYNIDSPEFEFEGDIWHLNLRDYHYEREDEEYANEYYTQIRLVRNSVDRHPCTQTYSLCIKDILGQDYWTSYVLTEAFTDDDHSGTVQELLESNLRRDANRIATLETISIQLTFHPPLVELTDKGAVIASTDASSHSAEAEQNFSNHQHQISCFPFSDDVDKLLQNLRELLLNEQKSDVTLHVKGKEFKVHQNILMCRSPVFCKMFDHDMVEQSSGTVQITDCSPEVFDVFLLYLYTGQLENVTVDNVVELYCIADKYDVKGLVTGCVNFMLSNLRVESFCNFISVALRYCEQELIDSGNRFFAKNMKEIVISESWKTFILENPAEANELLIKAFDKGKFVLLNQRTARD